VHTWFLAGNLRERDHLEDLGIDRRIILKLSSRSGKWGMDWIDVVRDRERWWALVNAVMKLRIP
jgi:hypothetical protein